MRKREYGSLANFATDPQSVLAWARTCPDTGVRVIGLLVYFCSMRIEEVLRLKHVDVVRGAKARQHIGGEIMREAGLHSELAIRIRLNRRTLRVIHFFDAEGAKLVELAPGGQAIEDMLKPYNRKILATAWRKQGLPLSLNDLRRASIHWLSIRSKLHWVHIAERSKLTVSSIGYINRLFETVTEEPWPTGRGVSDDNLDLDS